MARSFLSLPPSIMAVILATLHSTSVKAEQKSSFVWGFTGEEMSSNRLMECKKTYVFVNSTFYNETSTTTKGVPPYYIVAIPPNGIPIKSNLGTNMNNLIWTVPYSSGTRLLIGMVDGNDNAGGIATQIFPVVDQATPDTSCHSPATPSSVKLDVLSTGTLSTCGFFSMRFSGGQKPYTVTIAETDTIAATNVTMGPNDDQYDYLNQLKPGSQFIATVVDANGVYSQSTDLITTQGGSDTSCPGLSSSSKVYSAGFPLPAIAGIVGGVLLICGFIWWFIRRRNMQKNKMSSTDLLQVHPLSPRHQDGFSDHPHTHGITPYIVDSNQPYDPYADHPQHQPPHGGSKTNLAANSQVQPHSPGTFNVAVSNSGAGSSSAPWSPSTTGPGRDSSTYYSEMGGGSSSSGVVSPYGTGSSQQQLVVQHEDASDVVELPPAYRDRPPQAIPGAPARTEQRRRKN